MSHFYKQHFFASSLVAVGLLAFSGSVAYAQAQVRPYQIPATTSPAYGVTQRTPDMPPTPVRVPGASISAATLGAPTPVPTLNVVPQATVAPAAGRLPPPPLAQVPQTYAPANTYAPPVVTTPPVTGAPLTTTPPSAVYPSTTYPNPSAPLTLPPPPANAAPLVPATPQPTFLGEYPYQAVPTPIRPPLPSESFVRPLEQGAPGVTFNRSTTFAAPNPYAVPAVDTGGGTLTPTTYQPIATSGPVPRDYYLGKGVFGQPKVYVQGQPIRNGLRFVFP